MDIDTFMTITTVPVLNNKVKEFCKKIVVDIEPKYIEFLPEPDAMVLECIENVKVKVKRNGGSIIYGWQIWQFSRVMLEAEYHAVWKNDTGSLIDISPKQRNVKRVLFLEDPSLSDTRTQIRNIRKALIKDSYIFEFIKNRERRFDFLNKGERAFQFGKIQLTDEESAEIQELDKKSAEIVLFLMKKYGLNKPQRNEPCRCGSGLKYKNCCR